MPLSPRIIAIVLLMWLLTACKATNHSCPVTEPKWVLPPNDPAIDTPPAYEYYFANEDQSILASAERTGVE